MIVFLYSQDAILMWHDYVQSCRDFIWDGICCVTGYH